MDGIQQNVAYAFKIDEINVGIVMCKILQINNWALALVPSQNFVSVHYLEI